MKYRIIPVTAFEQNCSLVWCEQTGSAAFIDPGGEPDRLLDAAGREGVRIEMLLLTHGHLDHVGAARDLADRLGVPVRGPHCADRFWLQALPQQAEMFGLPHMDPFEPDEWLEEGARLMVGDVGLDVIHCPGHTPGHIVFYEARERLAFVGDVLFRGSVGRTDFFLARGDHAALIASIRNKLFPLGDDVRFVPGHGPTSTFGEERRSNPFVAE